MGRSKERKPRTPDPNLWLDILRGARLHREGLLDTAHRITIEAAKKVAPDQKKAARLLNTSYRIFRYKRDKYGLKEVSSGAS